MDPSIQRLTKLKKFTFWINVHTPIEKQSNQDWIPVSISKIRVHILKVPSIFWFLIMTFNLCFYHQSCVKWICIDIVNGSGHIGQTHSLFSKFLWVFDTELNAHQIGIVDNLFD